MANRHKHTTTPSDYSPKLFTAAESVLMRARMREWNREFRDQSKQLAALQKKFRHKPHRDDGQQPLS